MRDDQPSVMTSPIVFRPLYMERPWGGRSLERLYGRHLPPAPARIGESWELVDREDQQSVVAGGPLDGLTLQDLWRDHRAGIFGTGAVGHPSPRFPLLLKILDAEETLSLQVHPPAAVAAGLGGEPKTEMWFVAEARKNATVFAGVRPGTDRESFRRALAAGSAAECVPRLPVRTGDSIFIPSGRLHAIGAGLVIFEIQQNSDTTYRVFDWNRTGLDGRPRTLHVEESLACIDFADTAPALTARTDTTLAECAHFRVDRRELTAGEDLASPGFLIIAVVSGSVEADDFVGGPGDFFMLPAARPDGARLTAGAAGATLLEVRLP
jgi:mannose-6-phosphate isomerase